MTDSDLDELLKAARLVRMSASQQEQQRQSFAYGNTKVENDRITRKTIERAAEHLRRADGR